MFARFRIKVRQINRNRGLIFIQAGLGLFVANEAYKFYHQYLEDSKIEPKPQKVSIVQGPNLHADSFGRYPTVVGEESNFFDRMWTKICNCFPNTFKMMEETYNYDSGYDLTPEQKEQHKKFLNRDELPPIYSDETLKGIEYAKTKRLLGEPSWHPRYPSDRQFMDVYYRHKPDFDSIKVPLLVADKIEPPMGKKLSVVLDANVIYNRGSIRRRPGADEFLVRLSEKYELIIIGSPIKLSSYEFVAEETNLYYYNPIVDVDSLGLLASHVIPHEVYPKYPFEVFNCLKNLNRSPETTIIITPHPENVMMNPDSAVVIKPWDEFGGKDNSLQKLTEFMDFAAKKMITDGTSAELICPSFQDFDKDVVELWQEKGSRKLI